MLRGKFCAGFLKLLRLENDFDSDADQVNSEYRYFAKYDAFCLHIFDYACLKRKAYCNRRGSKLWKNCIH